MSKFSIEDKIEAVKRVLEDGLTIVESARILGCHKENVRKWVNFYEEYGLEGLKVQKTFQTYDGEFKLRVVEYLHSEHVSYDYVALKFNIPSKRSVMLWDKIYREEGPEALQKENRGRKSTGRPKGSQTNKKTKEDDLLKEIKRLRMENEYLKKLRALVQKRISQENGKKL